MLINYVIKSKHGKFIVVYRQDSGIYEVWKNTGIKTNQFLDFFASLETADNYAKKLGDSYNV